MVEGKVSFPKSSELDVIDEVVEESSNLENLDLDQIEMLVN